MQNDRKLTEALLEIARPAKLDGWPNPYDQYFEEEEKKEEENEHDRSSKAMD